MPADLREFAKIDVGWHLNRKWFTVERTLSRIMPDAMPDALRLAYADARLMHLVSILYSAQQRSDGVFPVALVKALAAAQSEHAIAALFEVGMWVNLPSGMAEVRDFLDHQPSSRSRSEASEKGRRAAAARWARDASSNASGIASSNAEERRVESKDQNTCSSTIVESVEHVPTDPAGPLATDFDAWWKLYPRKVAKGQAMKAYKTARKKTTAEALTAAITAQAPQLIEKGPAYCPHPATWLNGERWSDETASAPVDEWAKWRTPKVGDRK